MRRVVGHREHLERGARSPRCLMALPVSSTSELANAPAACWRSERRILVNTSDRDGSPPTGQAGRQLHPSFADGGCRWKERPHRDPQSTRSPYVASTCANPLGGFRPFRLVPAGVRPLRCSNPFARSQILTTCSLQLGFLRIGRARLARSLPLAGGTGAGDRSRVAGRDRLRELGGCSIRDHDVHVLRELDGRTVTRHGLAVDEHTDPARS